MPRHQARLLIVGDQKASLSASRHLRVWDWLNELSPGDLIVVNDTTVLKARLKVKRYGGGVGELLLLEPIGSGKWLCLARPAKRMRPGDYLWLEGNNKEPICLKVSAKDLDTGGRIVQFPVEFFDRDSIERLLNIYGEVPLPPYIERQLDADKSADALRYQTVYAAKSGAVAAPTAGLHFTSELLQSLEERGVRIAKVTLHVGAGTFKPVLPSA